MTTQLSSCKDGLYGIGHCTLECGCKGDKFIAGKKWPKCYRDKPYVQTYQNGCSSKHQTDKYGSRLDHDADSRTYHSAEFECGCFFQHWHFTREVGGSQMGWDETKFVRQDNLYCPDHEISH